MFVTALAESERVITGIPNCISGESIARKACEHGLRVTLTIDAMTDTRAQNHINTMTRISPRPAGTGSREQISDLRCRTLEQR